MLSGFSFNRGLKTIVGNGRLLQSFSHNIIDNGAIVFEDDTIIDIGKTYDMKAKYQNSQYHNAENKIIMPGLINCHGHYYSLFSRGLALKDPPGKTFLEVLERLWWRLDRSLQHEDSYLSAAAFNIEALKSGCTTVFDHHSSPNCIEGANDDIARAALECHIRNNIAYEVTDRNGLEGAKLGIEENRRFIERCYKTNPNPLLTASFGLHTSLTCSDDTLSKAVEALESVKEARNRVGFHIHVGECLDDEEICIKRHGKRIVDRLLSFGIARERSIFAHCVHLDDHELDLVKKSGTTIVTNPSANTGNAVGIARAVDIMKRGIPLTLGSDAITYDMFQELKFLYFIQKLNYRDPRVMGADSLRVLMEGNSNLASKIFKKKVGVLQPGAFADIILVDYDSPTPVSIENFTWHAVFGLSCANVNSTIVGGKFVVKNKELLTVDEKEILARCREREPGVAERF